MFDLKEPTAGQNICWWQIELTISLGHKPPIVQAYYKVIHNLQLTLPSLQSGEAAWKDLPENVSLMKLEDL
jgi:hypothetical protein